MLRLQETPFLDIETLSPGSGPASPVELKVEPFPVREVFLGQQVVRLIPGDIVQVASWWADAMLYKTF